MMERLFGISYTFSTMPDPDEISKNGAISYAPTVVYFEEKDGAQCIPLSFPYEFRVYPTGDLYPNSKSYYSKLGAVARENQERLVADYICAVILEQLRQYPNDQLLFVIRDDFETEKFVGRLGYLGLPLDRVTIYFITSNLKAFLTNYLTPFSETRNSDLAQLRDKTNELFGPFPEEEETTMLRTFFWTFSKQDLFPLRINLFSQFMDHVMLEKQREKIQERFSDLKWTELCDADGGRGHEKTRLPVVLARCDEYIKKKIHPNEKERR